MKMTDVGKNNIDDSSLRGADTGSLLFYAETLFRFLDPIFSCTAVPNIYEPNIQHFFVQLDARIRDIYSRNSDKYFSDIRREYEDMNLSEHIKDISDFIDYWEMGLRTRMSGWLLEIKKKAYEQKVLDGDFLKVAKILASESSSDETRNYFQNLLDSLEAMEKLVSYVQEASHDFYNAKTYELSHTSQPKEEPKHPNRYSIFAFDLKDKFEIWIAGDYSRRWAMKKKAKDEFKDAGANLAKLLQNIGKPLLNQTLKKNIVTPLSRALKIEKSELEKHFFCEEKKYGLNLVSEK